MKLKLLILVIALQAAWVIGTIALNEVRLRSAVVVRLETVPVDPRDLLRGDYVILSYKISRLPVSVFDATFADITNRPNANVYVRLTPRGTFHEAAAASLNRLESTPDGPVIRGELEAHQWGLSSSNVTVQVTYGLERYYVAEGTGNPTGKLTVDVALPHSGQGVIKQVYVDGVLYAEAMRNQPR
jgi:uncharacterized membrane-anchored protein